MANEKHKNDVLANNTIAAATTTDIPVTGKTADRN